MLRAGGKWIRRKVCAACGWTLDITCFSRGSDVCKTCKNPPNTSIDSKPPAAGGSPIKHVLGVSDE